LSEARRRPARALSAAGALRILIVKLSSLGDVVHALPVVADIRAAYPRARIDWVVEPAFAPLLQRTAGIAEVIECPLRRWTRNGLWRAATVAEVRAFASRLRRERYEAIVDLQGLTKSALIARLARGPSFGLANRTEGASHEAPARWLVTTAIRVEPHSHALDRSRELVAAALGTRAGGAPSFGLVARDLGAAGAGSGGSAGAGAAAVAAGGAAPSAGERPRIVVLIHGTSRADKLWPEPSWIELGRRLADEGWTVALPQSGSEEGRRARAIAAAIGGECTVWPALELGAFIDRLAATGGAIGVDSGPSHIAVALGLPHVQLYNFPTAWRTGPQPRHGAGLQVAVEGDPVPTVASVWAAWKGVQGAARLAAARAVPRPS
jgi:lipopolysaccharide heptosyltransferase I